MVHRGHHELRCGVGSPGGERKSGNELRVGAGSDADLGALGITGVEGVRRRDSTCQDAARRHDRAVRDWTWNGFRGAVIRPLTATANAPAIFQDHREAALRHVRGPSALAAEVSNYRFERISRVNSRIRRACTMNPAGSPEMTTNRLLALPRKRKPRLAHRQEAHLHGLRVYRFAGRSHSARSPRRSCVLGTPPAQLPGGDGLF